MKHSLARALAAVGGAAAVTVGALSLSAGSGAASTPPSPYRLVVAQYVADQLNATHQVVTTSSLKVALAAAHTRFGARPGYDISWSVDPLDPGPPYPIEIHAPDGTACINAAEPIVVVSDGACPLPVGK